MTDQKGQPSQPNAFFSLPAKPGGNHNSGTPSYKWHIWEPRLKPLNPPRLIAAKATKKSEPAQIVLVVDLPHSHFWGFPISIKQGNLTESQMEIDLIYCIGSTATVP